MKITNKFKQMTKNVPIRKKKASQTNSLVQKIISFNIASLRGALFSMIPLLSFAKEQPLCHFIELMILLRFWPMASFPLCQKIHQLKSASIVNYRVGTQLCNHSADSNCVPKGIGQAAFDTTRNSLATYGEPTQCGKQGAKQHALPPETSVTATHERLEDKQTPEQMHCG